MTPLSSHGLGNGILKVELGSIDKAGGKWVGRRLEGSWQ